MKPISNILRGNLASKRFIWILLTVSWCVFIFFRSSKPADISNQESLFFVDMINHFIKQLLSINYDIITQTIVRKTAHYLEYLITGYLMLKSINNGKNIGKRAMTAIALGVLYAASDEVHQYFIPGRAMRFFDIMIDSLGVITGVILGYKNRTKYKP